MEQIEMNFVEDWQTEILNDIKKEGIEISDDIRTESLIIKYFTYLRKKGIRQSYNVYKSKKFRCPAEFAEGADQIVSILEGGGDISPYLSKQVEHLKDDLMFNDWGVLHLHLGKEMEKNNKYIERTGPLLFIYFKENNAYLIDIYEHGDWTKKDILQTMYNNWPELIEPFTLKEVTGLSRTLSEANHQKIQKSGGFTLIEIKDANGNNIVIMPPGMGIASSGDAIIDIQNHDNAVEEIMILEDLIREEIDAIKKSLQENDIKIPEIFKFSVVRNQGNWQIKEENTSLIIKLY